MPVVQLANKRDSQIRLACWYRVVATRVELVEPFSKFQSCEVKTTDGEIRTSTTPRSYALMLPVVIVIYATV